MPRVRTRAPAGPAAESRRISHVAVHRPDYYRRAKPIHHAGQARANRRRFVNDVDLILFDQVPGRAALHELRDQVHQPIGGKGPHVVG